MASSGSGLPWAYSYSGVRFGLVANEGGGIPRRQPTGRRPPQPPRWLPTVATQNRRPTPHRRRWRSQPHAVGRALTRRCASTREAVTKRARLNGNGGFTRSGFASGTRVGRPVSPPLGLRCKSFALGSRVPSGRAGRVSAGQPLCS